MFVSDLKTPAIMHVDMDAFFASVEQARRPELRGRPVIVGGRRERRSVVAAASYEARAFGVHSAMPVAQAERLCPQAVFLPGDMAAYVAVHRRLVELCRRVTDRVEVVSIDEAFLDVTGSRRLFGPPQAIARRLQQQVYEAEAITCSIGIGPNKLLAKLATNLNKPAGLGVLDASDVDGRLRDLPVRELAGIGPVAERRLRDLGLTTVGMVQDVPLPFLAAAFGRSAETLKQLAFGRSFSPVRTVPRAPRSMSRETTFAEDIADRELLHRALLALVDELMTRLRGKGYAARTVAVKVRDDGFATVGRRLTLSRPTTATRTVHDGARRLFDSVELGDRRVRLIGVALSDLCSGALQLSLDDRWRETVLDEVVDRVRARYGTSAIRPAAACARVDGLC
jgi:DNA polymerase IV